VGQRTWKVHLHRDGRRDSDAGEFLADYRDVGDQPGDEPEVGSVIFLGLDRYRVVFANEDGTPTGGTLIVAPVTEGEAAPATLRLVGGSSLLPPSLKQLVDAWLGEGASKDEIVKRLDELELIADEARQNLIAYVASRVA
jgi:hypothetical protein